MNCFYALYQYRQKIDRVKEEYKTQYVCMLLSHKEKEIRKAAEITLHIYFFRIDIWHGNMSLSALERVQVHILLDSGR